VPLKQLSPLFTMALSIRVATRSTSSLRQFRAPALAGRNLTTRSAPKCLYPKTQAVSSNAKSVRMFSCSRAVRNQTQTAPNAKAYLESGVIKGAKNPVDVKKVLVIGSGGLSIGQAGEFDYSGLCYPFWPMKAMSQMPVSKKGLLVSIDILLELNSKHMLTTLT
jgi:hypothetical protein